MKRTFSAFAALLTVPMVSSYVPTADGAFGGQQGQVIQTQPAPGQVQGQPIPRQTQPGQPVQGQVVQGQVIRQEATSQKDLGNDKLIAHCMHLGNQEEIAIAKFAQEKAESSKVKEFAQMMVKEHEQALKQLPQQYQSNKPALQLDQESTERSRPDSNQSRENNDQTNQRRADLPGANSQAALQGSPVPQSGRVLAGGQIPASQSAGASANGLLEMQTEIAKQCLEDAKEKLSSESGEKFDKCFMGMQIAMHESMKSKLSVFERHASQELKPVVAKALETTKEHLDEAESIMKELVKEDKDSK